MKKFGIGIITLGLLLTSVWLMAACDLQQVAEKLIADVQVTGLTKQYMVGQTLDLSTVNVVVTYTDQSQYLMPAAQGVYDVADGEMPDTARWCLQTDGLAAWNGQELTADAVGTYVIKCVLRGSEITYEVATVQVVPALDYDYSQENELSRFYSKLVQTHQAHLDDINNAQLNEAARFTKVADTPYAVGDDNAFILEPTVTLIPLRGSSAQAFSPQIAVDLVVRDQQGNLVAPGTDYEFDPATYRIKFADLPTGQRVGNIYQITMTPKYFDLSAYQIDPIQLTVQVYDGWNAYDASDLARINMMDDVRQAGRFYKANANNNRIFYDDTNKAVTGNFFQIWQQYFQERPAIYPEIKAINGLFLHRDIVITESDLPAAYLISAAEAGWLGDLDAVGTLRDMAYLYNHNLRTGETFTMNGNYFTLDFSKMQKQRTYYDADAKRLYAYKQKGHHTFSGSEAFTFFGLTEYTNLPAFADRDAMLAATAQVYWQNVSFVGNGAAASANDPMATIGALNLVHTGSNIHLKVDNCLMNSFSIALMSAYGSYQLEIADTKIFDGVNSGLWLWCSSNNTITNSVFKRFGGACILSTSQTTKDGAVDHLRSQITADANSVFESYVDGTQTWFQATTGASLLATQFTGTDVFTRHGATILNDEGKFNLVLLALDSGTLTSTKPYVHTSFTYGENTYESATLQAVTDTLQQVAPQYASAVVVQSSDGTLALTNLGQGDAGIFVDPATMQEAVLTTDDTTRDLLYIRLGVTLAGNAAVGMVVDLY